MSKNESFNSLSNHNINDIVELITKFLKHTDDLLDRGIITEELYHELREKKLEFLKKVGK